MPSYNRAEFIGHLGRDPETRYTPQGNPITTFSVAVNNRKKVNGEWTDSTLWIKVQTWGKTAENASQKLSKGQLTLVSGKIDLEEWTGNDGRPRAGMVLNFAEFVALEKSQDGPPRASKPPVQQPAETQPDISDDDIPF